MKNEEWKMENDDGWELGETKTTNMPEEVICALKLEDLNKGATIAFDYDTPTAQVYTGEMDSLIGQSTNLDDEPDTP